MEHHLRSVPFAFDTNHICSSGVSQAEGSNAKRVDMTYAFTVLLRTTSSATLGRFRGGDSAGFPNILLKLNTQST